MPCLLVFHEIREAPRKTQNVVMDHRVFGNEVQSKSLKASILMSISKKRKYIVTENL